MATNTKRTERRQRTRRGRGRARAARRAAASIASRDPLRVEFLDGGGFTLVAPPVLAGLDGDISVTPVVVERNDLIPLECVPAPPPTPVSGPSAALPCVRTPATRDEAAVAYPPPTHHLPTPQPHVGEAAPGDASYPPETSHLAMPPPVPPGTLVPGEWYRRPDPPAVEEEVFKTHAIPERREHWWPKFWKSLAVGAQKTLMYTCCQGEHVASWELHEDIKRDTAKAMLEHIAVPSDRTMQSVIAEGVKRVAEKDVKLVPRLVADAVAKLRIKLGSGAINRSVPGNITLVRAETAKLLRHYGLRDMDASAHLAEVERCFFEDDEHYRVTAWRASAAQSSLLVRMFVPKAKPVCLDY